MLKVTQNNINLITNALIQFSNAKFDYTIDVESSGNIGYLIKGTNALGSSISKYYVWLIIVDRKSFDEEREKLISDVNLVFDTTKLKLDNISFKEEHLKKVGNGKTWLVENLVSLI